LPESLYFWITFPQLSEHWQTVVWARHASHVRWW
jgi:hypothetical protein